MERREIMINYNDPNDPNYDPYWPSRANEENAGGGQFDPLPMDDLEFEEMEEQLIREMREEGLLRPTLVKPGEHASDPVEEPVSPTYEPEEDLPF
jgi:hypothetical protein